MRQPDCVSVLQIVQRLTPRLVVTLTCVEGDTEPLSVNAEVLCVDLVCAGARRHGSPGLSTTSNQFLRLFMILGAVLHHRRPTPG